MSIELIEIIEKIKTKSVSGKPTSPVLSIDIVVSIGICGIRSYFNEIYCFFQEQL
jgi:hypothetical protein